MSEKALIEMMLDALRHGAQAISLPEEFDQQDALDSLERAIERAEMYLSAPQPQARSARALRTGAREPLT